LWIGGDAVRNGEEGMGKREFQKKRGSFARRITTWTGGVEPCPRLLNRDNRSSDLYVKKNGRVFKMEKRAIYRARHLGSKGRKKISGSQLRSRREGTKNDTRNARKKSLEGKGGGKGGRQGSAMLRRTKRGKMFRGQPREEETRRKQ